MKDSEYQTKLTFGEVLYEVKSGQKPVNALLEHETFLQRIFGISLYILHNAEKVEDLRQDVCVRLIEHWERINGLDDNIRNEDDFFSMLFVTALNLHRDEIRRKKRQGIIVEEPVEDVQLPYPQTDPILKIMFKELKAFVYRLPEKQRQVVELWLSEERPSFRKIAPIVDLSHTAVRDLVIDAIDKFLNPPTTDVSQKTA